MAEAKAAYTQAVAEGYSAFDRIGCRCCEQACPRHLPIPDHLKQAAELFSEG